jgi:predicted double-glycine peptidase
MPILDFPELRQTYDYDCGACALQAVLAYYGIERFEGELIKSAKTSKTTGTTIPNLLRLLKASKLKYDSRSMSPAEAREYIVQGIPVILLLQAWSDKKKKDYSSSMRDGHYVVAIGFDDARIIFEDPYVLKRTFLTDQELIKRWHGHAGGKPILNHGIAVYGKKSTYRPKQTIRMK